MENQIKKFFYPQSITVIGASRYPGKVGHEIFRNLVENGWKVFPINPKADQILGIKAYASVLDVKEKIDLAIITVPSQIVPQVLEECGQKGIKNVIIISAGFGEVGRKDLDEMLIRIANKYGILILGPNCFGIINSINKMNTTFFKGIPINGKIAFISQSGALGVAFLDWVIKNNYGISYFISIGNALQIGFEELLEFLGKDENTDVILIYMESLKNGKKFREVLEKIEKPVIVLKAGKSEEGEKAIKSHTGALASSYRVYKSIFKQLKVLEVEKFWDMLKIAQLYEKYKYVGDKVCIITNAGGAGVLTTDALKGLKIEIPKEIINDLNQVLPETWSHNNPIDLVGDAKADRYEKTFEVLKKHNFYDIYVVLFTPQAVSEPLKTAHAIYKFEREIKKPVIACFMGGEKIKEAIKFLRENGIIVFEEPENMAEMIKKLVELGRIKKF